MAKPKLDITPEEEQDLVETSEHEEWVSVGDIETQRRYWQEHARTAAIFIIPADFPRITGWFSPDNIG